MSADCSGRDALVSQLEARAVELGFTLFGVAGPESSTHLTFYESWLGRSLHGEMSYLSREDSIARRGDLRRTMEGVRSVVVVGHEYYAADARRSADDPSRAVLARYARGSDYHDVVKAKLDELLVWLDGRAPGGVSGRSYVDTGPILERDLARRAGLGWFGKNTMLISPSRGSYFFIGLLLLDLELPVSEPFAEDRCGTCRACLEACPTGALLGRDERGAPVIDARRCISYLTIELRGAIPVELRPAIGNRVFGCDICQEVCPWNERFASPADEPAYRSRDDLGEASLAELTATLLDLDEAGFRARFRGSPLRRARRSGLLRNLCVGLGNRLSDAGPGYGGAATEQPGTIEARQLLARALRETEPLVRMHAVWALGMDGTPQAIDALRAHEPLEDDPEVLRELDEVLSP